MFAMSNVGAYSMLEVKNIKINPHAAAFCKLFFDASPQKRMLLGRNIYGENIAKVIEIGSFVDDFTEDTEFLGKPVIKSKDIPTDALVVSTLLGRPLTGNEMLRALGVEYLDYFSFYENAGLDFPVLRFWGGFKEEFNKNRDKFDWIESLLSDLLSKDIYEKIISFRLSGNLEYMKGFSDRQRYQYFENFLNLPVKDGVFIDVGGFDGFTSQEFIKRCPDFRAVYFFEPDPNNYEVAGEVLDEYANVTLMQIGLSDKKQFLRFSSGGSVSAISKDGDKEIEVDALDNLVHDHVTFIKMDIEGAEGGAIKGARRTILENHPILAICVYHKDNDIWEIPELVFSIRSDYDIYLRHYTEGVAETVMFFMPKLK